MRMTANEIHPSVCDLIDGVQISLDHCWRHFLEAQEQARELRRRIESLDGKHVVAESPATRRVQKDYVADVIKALAALGCPVSSEELLNEYLKTHTSKKPFARNLKRALKEGRIVKLPDAHLALPDGLQSVAAVSGNVTADA